MSRFERHAQSPRKHGPLSDSGAPKAPNQPPANRPGWKGPGYVKKQVPRQQPDQSAPAIAVQEQLLPVELQQLVLNIFRDTFPASTDFELLKPTLNEINIALRQNDLQRAFGREDYREGYALRWSPSRSLAYANVLAWICDARRRGVWFERLLNHEVGEGIELEMRSTLSVVCFGGGAAEIMAFAALLRHLRPDTTGVPDQGSAQAGDSSPLPGLAPTPLLRLHFVDIADWSSVVSKLQAGLEAPPTLSKYASATARASNTAFLSKDVLNATTIQANIFNLSTEELRIIVGPDPTMITLLLTLNDLYSTSISKATAFLRRLDTIVPKDSLLLVLDKPEASSEVVVPSEDGKRSEEVRQSYQMNWLLDRVLLGKSLQYAEESKTIAAWEKIVDERARHYVLEDKLRYPASLETMKFQMHLYRRL